MSNLKTIDMDDSNKKTISQLWKFLAQQRMKISIDKLEFENVYKHLFLNVDDEEIKANLVKKLCKGFQKFPDFKGDDYLIAIRDLDEFSQNEGVNIPLELIEIEQTPEIFVDYVFEAEDDYLKYKLNTNSEKLDEYYTSLLPDSLTRTGVLSYLKSNEKYAFPILLASIEELIVKGDISQNTFKNIFYVYKTIAGRKLLPAKLHTTTRQNLLNAFSQKPESEEYCELVAMSIAMGTPINSSFNDNQIGIIAENIEYYSTYEDLLINNYNIHVLNQVLKHMTINKKGMIFSIEKILPMFFQIRNRIAVSESDLLSQLNRWERFAPKSINKDNIETIIPDATFFQYSRATSNNLTKYLNETVIEKFVDINSDELYNNRGANNYYWNIVVKNFIGSELMQQLPDNLTDFGKRILKDVANGSQNLPIPDNYGGIINKLDKRKTKSTIKDIRDDYSGAHNITPPQFKFFEKWFESQGDFKESVTISKSVVRRIIRPVIQDSECLNLILAKSGFYAKVINHAGDDAIDLKDDICKKIQNSTDAKLIAFAASIGVKKEEK